MHRIPNDVKKMQHIHVIDRYFHICITIPTLLMQNFVW